MNIEEIKNELQKRLSPSRYEHSLEVAKVAVLYAKKSGFDETKAEIAGLLHDVARELSNEQLNEVAKKYQVKLTKYNENFPPSIHAKVGAFIAINEFDITDDEILRAISNHVSGRPCMETLEKIIYLSDHMTRLNTISEEKANELMEESLNDALYRMLGMVIKFDAKNKKPIDERTLQTFDWMIEVIENKEQSGPRDFDESVWDDMYNRMDGLLEQYSKCALLDFHAENIRDIGGYQTIDKHYIKKHKIIRSGNLEEFTDLDFKRINEYGINYVIDLRENYEKKKILDTKDYIHYVEIPFESIGDYKSYLDMLFEWVNECDSPKELAWLSSKYVDVFDIDDMYIRNLFNPDLDKRFKQILEIMLRDDCTGVLICCNSGKDRTGMIAAMIMNVLGVDHNVVLDDYMISCIPYYALTMNWLNKIRRQDYNLEVQKQLVSVLGVEEDRPKRLNKEILNKYKDYKKYFNVDNYLNDNDLKRFRDKYLYIE